VAPTKTYNLPGLRVSAAIVSDPELRTKLKRHIRGLIPTPNVLGLDAAVAAYRDGGPWLDGVLSYLRANRDTVAAFTAEHFEGLRSTLPEATYLTWLDCREAGLGDDPYRYFLERARVALSDGRPFGPGGTGFVRLNFACPRSTLQAALERMAEALK
jgi:cysteine-S-conjugate beta-lyase